jgi:hypothetical protein
MNAPKWTQPYGIEPAIQKKFYISPNLVKNVDNPQANQSI